VQHTDPKSKHHGILSVNGVSTAAQAATDDCSRPATYA